MTGISREASPLPAQRGTRYGTMLDLFVNYWLSEVLFYLTLIAILAILWRIKR